MRNKKLIILFSILCSLTLIIVMSSVIFSVQHVYENCTLGDSSVIIDGDMTIGEKVLASHNFKKGKSIFLADKDAAARSIEAAIPSVKVEKIEKKFPNRIYIEYEILFDYLEVHSGGKFYILSDGCKITNIVSERYNIDKIIHVYMSGNIGEHKAGEKLTSTRAGEVQALSEILSSFKRLGQEYYEITQMFEFIDIRNEYEFIYMKTSMGVYFRIMDWSNIDLKLQAALSAYKDTPAYRNGGTITVSNNLAPTYSPEVLYPKTN